MASPTRPVLRYFGGKWLLAPKIIDHFPPHRTYVEPYGGAASVLMRKPRSHAEIYNDLDDDLVNLFEVMRDSSLAVALIEAVALTPFARTEFEKAYERCDDPVERARRLVVRSYMGHGSTASNIERSTGFRCDSSRSGTTPARDWANLPPALALTVRRMAGVVVERRPALDIIERFDGPDTLIYADPPYVWETRSQKVCRGGLYSGYVHEMDDAAHAALIEKLQSCRSMVVLSGYANALYDEELSGWRRVEMSALADGARERTEVLWLNTAAVNAAGGLFS